MAAPLNIKLGDEMPNFKMDTTHGEIDFHTYCDGSWVVLFSHPDDFTPVCTTELATMAKMQPEFAKRGVKLMGISCNDTDSHLKWIEDVQSTPYAGGAKVEYPIVADPKRELAVQLSMLDPEEKDKAGLPLTARALFVVGPDKKLKLQILYPATTGRNADEILRVVDSLQLTAKHKVATPVNWKHGEKVMVTPAVSNEEAKEKLGDISVMEVPSGKGYIRMVEDPSSK